ncbi:MAG TPA: class I SAM-dependent methyltransferase [Pseudonocardia sp.]|nr:class I SAM-dependent methyltransferase [Pseudonocardia sp.]
MTDSGLDALLTGDGRALLSEVAATVLTPSNELAVAERLRARYPVEMVNAALGMTELRRRARAKFTLADDMYFTRDGLEQASGEASSRHRARRFAGAGRVVDLCTGIGGDLIGLAGADGVAEVTAVDRDPLHLRMAVLNAAAYRVGAEVRTSCVDVRDADLDGAGAVFVDPARRAAGRRLRTGESEPPLAWCAALTERVGGVGVKAAPGLDRASVPPGWEVEFVAHGRDLKEAVLWSPSLAGAGVASRATVLPSGVGGAEAGARGSGAETGARDSGADTGARDTGAEAGPGTDGYDGVEFLAVPGDPVECREPGEYLLDPNPAITRAGLVEDLARVLGAWKIDPMIAFLSADRPLTSRFARTLRVLDSAPWREKELAARLRALGIGSVDVRRRGLAGDVDVLRRRLKLPPGRPATLVMTRVDDQPWALICEDA